MNYKLFGKSGLRVSEICLGTMTFGTEWGWGADKQTSKEIFDAYANGGGNFVDTANRYTEGTSEKFVGEFIKSDRDHFVLATKYTLYDQLGDLNFAGNHRKNLMRSVEGSLKRLDTDFVDVLWVHAWDKITPMEEIMRGLEDLVTQGKIHYIGVSDTPAWVISKCNTLSSLRGWAQFVGLQIEYSLIQRTPDRDLIPMANHFGMTVTPWAPLAGGVLTGKYLKGDTGRVKEDSERRNERSTAITKTLVEIAGRMEVTPSQVAIRWAMQGGFNSIPIVGARKVEHIADNLGATNIIVPEEEMNKLDEVSKIDLGFPHDFLEQEGVNTVVFAGEKGRLDL